MRNGRSGAEGSRTLDLLNAMHLTACPGRPRASASVHDTRSFVPIVRTVANVHGSSDGHTTAIRRRPLLGAAERARGHGAPPAAICSTGDLSRPPAGAEPGAPGGVRPPRRSRRSRAPLGRTARCPEPSRAPEPPFMRCVVTEGRRGGRGRPERIPALKCLSSRTGRRDAPGREPPGARIHPFRLDLINEPHEYLSPPKHPLAEVGEEAG